MTNKINITKHFFIALISILYSTSLFAQTPNIVLGRPTDTSMTVSILNDQAMNAYIEYGTTSGTYSNIIPTFTNVAGTPDEIELHNLIANTKYYYHLKYKATTATTFNTTPEYSFYTQRAKGSEFTFTLEADEHLYDKKGVKSIYQICLNNQAKDKPDFMMSLGDIFGDDHNWSTITSGALDTLHKDYRPFLGSLCHSVPFYICLGNHEGENDYYYNQNLGSNLCVWGTQWRKFYYPNPYPNGFYTGNTDNEPYGIGNPENYYSWTWGDALFVVLDVYRDQCYTTLDDKPGNWNWTLGLPQYTWLKNTLENSTSKFKFVFAHHIRGQGRGGVTNATQFEWGGLDNGVDKFANNRPGWAKPIHKLFVDNGVNIFFQGHDHVFAHEVLDGVTYQAVPMPSDSTYEIGKLANADAYVSDTLDGTGHIRVTVNSTCTKVDYVRAYLPADTFGVHKNGEVAFSYNIGICAPANTNNLTKDNLFDIYPNPANSFLDIKTEEKIKQVFLRNSIGELIQISTFNRLNIENIINGIYFVTIQTDKNNITKKIIIQH